METRPDTGFRAGKRPDDRDGVGDAEGAKRRKAFTENGRCRGWLWGAAGAEDVSRRGAAAFQVFVEFEGLPKKGH
jgi:hypothetical protein